MDDHLGYQAVRPNRQQLVLDPDSRQALQDEGCLLLKQATNLETVESTMSEDLWSNASVTREVVTNQVSSFRNIPSHQLTSDPACQICPLLRSTGGVIYHGLHIHERGGATHAEWTGRGIEDDGGSFRVCRPYLYTFGWTC